MMTFTAWVTEMFTFCENGYTVAMAFATKIIEIQWLPLTKIGFLMVLGGQVDGQLPPRVLQLGGVHAGARQERLHNAEVRHARAVKRRVERRHGRTPRHEPGWDSRRRAEGPILCYFRAVDLALNSPPTDPHPG